MDKIEIARRQLGSASHLFIDDLDPVSVQTLAAAAREVLERECRSRNLLTILDVIADKAGRPNKDVRRLADQYGKVFRHNRPEDSAIDQALSMTFSDQSNDFVLFIAWHDYRHLTGAMPVEAQAIYSWVEAMYPEKMSIKHDFRKIAPLMDIINLTRSEQKKRLKALASGCQQWEALRMHSETEDRPLIFGATHQ